MTRTVLAEAGGTITRFFNSGVAELKGKLGPINWQFLPTKKFDPVDFEAFLKLLPRDIAGRPLRHAVEVRHESFRTGEFVDLLRAYGIGIVLTDKDGFPHIPDVTSSFVYARLQRTLVIRHTSGDRIVAMIEVLSPGNKSSRHAIRSFLDKAVAALDGGIHLLLVDVHPPGPRDPNGIHGALLNEIGTEDYVLASERPLTAVAYIGGAVVEAFVAHFAVGEPIPEMPLFLTRENYVRVPLEEAYTTAWDDVPPQYQEVLLASS